MVKGGGKWINMFFGIPGIYITKSKEEKEMFKKFTVVLALCVLLVSAIGFATTLTVIGPWAGAEKEGFMPVLKAFTEKTGIDVEYRTYRFEDLRSMLPAQFSAKRTPGDVIFMNASWISKNTKHAADLSGVVNEGEFVPGILTPMEANGKLYGAAFTGKIKPGFWYRKSFFAKHGLTVPHSWDEFVTLLQKIKMIPGIKAPIASGDGTGWPLSDVTEHFLITFGGQNLDKDLIAGNIKWESYTVKAIFEKLVFLLKSGYFSEPTEWTTILKQWWNGDYALYFMGSWITGMVDNPDDLGVFALPGCKGMVFCPDCLFVPKYSKNVEDAKKLAAFLVGREGQTISVKLGGHVATNLGVSLGVYPGVDKGVAELAKGVANLNDLDDTIGGEFQTSFWDQLKLLWVKPDRLDDVLKVLDEKMK